jgi:hypothetical protein
MARAQQPLTPELLTAAPDAAQGTRLRRLQGELQMLLYQHPSTTPARRRGATGQRRLDRRRRRAGRPRATRPGVRTDTRLQAPPASTADYAAPGRPSTARRWRRCGPRSAPAQRCADAVRRAPRAHAGQRARSDTELFEQNAPARVPSAQPAMKFEVRDVPPRSAWALEQAGVHPLLARLYAARGVQAADELDDGLARLLPPPA